MTHMDRPYMMDKWHENHFQQHDTTSIERIPQPPKLQNEREEVQKNSQLHIPPIIVTEHTVLDIATHARSRT